MTTSRFAPSPTGLLHLGHAWSALQAHDLARATGGSFLLRIEDIDEGRCRAEFVAAIEDDLRWLGLDWDGPVLIQSQRASLYAGAVAQLAERGLAYRCWCTRAEIAAAASAPQGDAPPLYPGTCRHRAPPAPDQPCCWRLDVAAALAETGPLHWQDSRAGTIAARPQDQGDIVIARKDALSSYHMAVTIDDAAQGVTDVVRGRDLFAATHVHVLLQALLGLPTPLYHHHPLIAGPSGTRLAKRDKAPTIRALRERGTDPVQLVAELRGARFPFGFSLMED